MLLRYFDRWPAAAEIAVNRPSNGEKIRLRDVPNPVVLPGFFSFVSELPFKRRLWAFWRETDAIFLSIDGKVFDLHQRRIALTGGSLVWTFSISAADGSVEFSTRVIHWRCLDPRYLLDRFTTGGEPLDDVFFPAFVLDCAVQIADESGSKA